ncbi:hypothetical protein DRO03_09460 [Methanosarcinales archaeon]|nr:MAG: hypothetical protein DRO03_09460 [Methanosarcinales archaeon]
MLRIGGGVKGEMVVGAERVRWRGVLYEEVVWVPELKDDMNICARCLIILGTIKSPADAIMSTGDDKR